MGADLLDAGLVYLRRYGWSVFPVRGKVAAGKWKNFQSQRPTEGELRRMFARSGVTGLAVILGEASGDLWARDFDEAQAYPRWAAAFPDLARRAPTVATARGSHVYGCWPGVTFAALADGELRAGGGCYCLIPPSKHPSGPDYTWRIPPAATIPRLDPAAAGLDRPWGGVTQSTDRGVIQTSDFRVQSAGGRGRSNERAGGVPLSVLLKEIPDVPHQNHDALFHLARRIRGLEVQRGERYSMSDLQEAASAWCAANPHLRDGLTPDDYALELMGAMGCVRVPYGGEPTLDAAWKAALVAAPIPEVAPYGEAMGQLAGWCRELQKVAGGRPFYLSSKSVADRFGLPEAMSGWRRLKLLCRLGVLERVEAGDRRRAATFRYKLPLEP